ncbi:hypothetical protein NDU88_006968 [Pleurodeles waltl]|uniref:Uncharacterized protein n=1 Tax=Pleurodeles waltl TaxID=8319 RepID=A0AAV7VT28_PLEWA|nr:hypothetical protein NDU88_006968 [Pleurodeles waltl]
MIRCPGGTSESIALQQCDAEKKQEVNAQEGKEKHVEREDADEQKRENNYTEATRRRESGNGKETGESDPPTNRGRTAVTKGPCGIQKHATSLEEVRTRIWAVAIIWIAQAAPNVDKWASDVAEWAVAEEAQLRKRRQDGKAEEDLGVWADLLAKFMGSGSSQGPQPTIDSESTDNDT